MEYEHLHTKDENRVKKSVEILPTVAQIRQLKANGKSETPEEWHASLGHLSLSSLRKMAGLVTGLPKLQSFRAVTLVLRVS